MIPVHGRIKRRPQIACLAGQLPWKQYLAAIRGSNSFTQIARGVHIVELGGLDEPVQDRRRFSSALRLGAVVIFTTYDGTSNAAFCCVVVERHEDILENTMRRGQLAMT